MKFWRPLTEYDRIDLPLAGSWVGVRDGGQVLGVCKDEQLVKVVLSPKLRLCELIDEPAQIVVADFEPDWSTAPEWANWWAADADGFSCWYRREPVRGKYAWVIDGWYNKDYFEVHRSIQLPLGIDWRTTLRKRPVLVE